MDVQCGQNDLEKDESGEANYHRTDHKCEGAMTQFQGLGRLRSLECPQKH